MAAIHREATGHPVAVVAIAHPALLRARRLALLRLVVTVLRVLLHPVAVAVFLLAVGVLRAELHPAAVVLVAMGLPGVVALVVTVLRVHLLVVAALVVTVLPVPLLVVAALVVMVLPVPLLVVAALVVTVLRVPLRAEAGLVVTALRVHLRAEAAARVVGVRLVDLHHKQGGVHPAARLLLVDTVHPGTDRQAEAMDHPVVGLLPRLFNPVVRLPVGAQASKRVKPSRSVGTP